MVTPTPRPNTGCQRTLALWNNVVVCITVANFADNPAIGIAVTGGGMLLLKNVIFTVHHVCRILNTSAFAFYRALLDIQITFFIFLGIGLVLKRMVPVGNLTMLVFSVCAYGFAISVPVIWLSLRRPLAGQAEAE